MTRSVSWGTGIVIAYIAFATTTVGFVAFAMRTPSDLVSPDYYERSLRQDDRTAATGNALALRRAVTVGRSPDGRTLVVTIPQEQAHDARGTVTLYRASDVRADRTVALAVNGEGTQTLSFPGLAPGRWIAQVAWTSGGRPYYVEQAVVTP